MNLVKRIVQSPKFDEFKFHSAIKQNPKASANYIRHLVKFNQTANIGTAMLSSGKVSIYMNIHVSIYMPMKDFCVKCCFYHHEIKFPPGITIFVSQV